MRVIKTGRLKMKIFNILTTVALVGVLFVGCGNQNARNEILVGEYSSLTGTTATFGQSTHHGLELAINEVNAAGGVLGKQIKLLTEDDQSKPEEAATAATKLITRDGVIAVLGEVASSRSLAAAPICQSYNIPMISPASTNPAVTQKGNYIFRVCYIDPFQGEVMAKFAFNSLKVTRAAILKDVKNDYSVGLAQFFQVAFDSMGGEVVAIQSYSEGDTDFRAQLTALKGANPQIIIVPGYYTECALIAKQARELNMNMPIMGGDGWDSTKLIEVGGDALNNTYYISHYSPDDTASIVRNFVTTYKQKYSQVPDAMGALGYDAARLLCDAIKRAGSTDSVALRNAIADTKDFPGVTGKITIDENRNARKTATIIAVENKEPHFKETIQP